MHFITSLCISILSILLFLFNAHLYLLSYWDYANYLFESDVNEETFDYVIVGCGTAGALIAHRLSAAKNIKFAIVEAGGSGGPLLNAPAVGPLLHNTIHDWRYMTIPQNNACLGMEGKRCRWVAGKIAGGSAKINNMIHFSDYADEIVDWFKGKYTLEYINDNLNRLERDDLPVEELRYESKLAAHIIDAAFEMNRSHYDTISKIGFQRVVLNQKDGARWTTSHTLFQNPCQNCKIILNALVEKVLFDDDNKKKAIGIVFERHGSKYKFLAKRGVILSAGSVGTPKILMLSGVGPRGDLEKLGIKVVQDSSVGRNLIDHVTTGLDLVLSNRSLDLDVTDMVNPMNAWSYFYKGAGPWTSASCEMIAFFKTQDKLRHPDLQFMILPLGVGSDYGLYLKKIVGVAPHVWANYFSKSVSNNPITVSPIVLHPKSRGHVKLASGDPTVPPVIDPKYFSREEDLDVILKGIEIIKEMLKMESMKRAGFRLNDNAFPGCEAFRFDTRDYWTCYARHLTLSVFHPAGTCRMGDPNESTSVVDYNFKVLGVDNLYVADASIFPELPSGNPNAAVALVAQLFANELLSSL